MRAEQPCRTQASEFQTEPYSASYGQKPFWRVPVKIWVYLRGQILFSNKEILFSRREFLCSRRGILLSRRGILDSRGEILFSTREMSVFKKGKSCFQKREILFFPKHASALRGSYSDMIENWSMRLAPAVTREVEPVAVSESKSMSPSQNLSQINIYDEKSRQT